MKKLFLLFILILPVYLSAEVCVVDLQQVLSESKAGQAAKSQLESRFKKGKADIDQKKENLRAAQEKIKQQSALLSEDALQKKVKELRTQEMQLAKEMQDYQEKFTKDNNSKINGIMEKVRSILAGLAKEKGASVVIEKNDVFVLYAKPELDLTADVIKRLDG